MKTTGSWGLSLDLTHRLPRVVVELDDPDTKQSPRRSGRHPDINPASLASEMLCTLTRAWPSVGLPSLISTQELENVSDDTSCL